MSGHTAEKDATIKALVRALEKRHGKGKKWALPTIPIGTRVRVRDSGAAGVGTVVGRDGYGFDGVAVIFDEPAPRGFEDGCCAGVEQCEVIGSASVTPSADGCPDLWPTGEHLDPPTDSCTCVTPPGEGRR